MITQNESIMMSEGMLKQPQFNKYSNLTSYSLNENTRDGIVNLKIDESGDNSQDQKDSVNKGWFKKVLSYSSTVLKYAAFGQH
jgi:hypothetical protein